MASNAAGCVDYWRREMSGTSRDASRLRPVGLASRHPAAGRTARGRTSVGEGYRMSLGEIALAVARGTLLGCVDRHCVDQIEERCVDGRVPGVGGQRTESEGPAPSCGVAQHTRTRTTRRTTTAPSRRWPKDTQSVRVYTLYPHTRSRRGASRNQVHGFIGSLYFLWRYAPHSQEKLCLQPSFPMRRKVRVWRCASALAVGGGVWAAPKPFGPTAEFELGEFQVLFCMR